MIESRWVFDDEYPTDILYRNEELNSLSRLLKPTTVGGWANDVLIYGPSGIGKTATTRRMLRDLRRRADVSSTLIEYSGETQNGFSTRPSRSIRRRRSSTGTNRGTNLSRRSRD